MTDRRPSITGIGEVLYDGTTLTIRGWHLGICAALCRCHLHPLTGQLVIAQNEAAGTLGLATFRTDGRRCTCCAPWPADELVAILDFLSTVAALPEPAT